jgi:hypothetical protein
MTTYANYASATARTCCRCGKDLTDAASLEVGIGPICRKLDNALLAATIPADLVSARDMFAKVNTAKLDTTTADTLGNLEAALCDPANEGCLDWRTEVKRIEWVLSFPTTTSNVTFLTAVVRALGYVGVASLLAGDASTGKATVAFETGRLFLRGSKNVAGAAAFKKLADWRFHPAKGEDKAAWSVPAHLSDGFKTAVLNHWPCATGLSDAVAAAKTWTLGAVAVKTGVDAAVQFLAKPVVAPAPVPAPKAVPAVEIGYDDGAAWVRTPYNAAFVAGIKTIPYDNRAWDAPAKVWWVKGPFVALLKELVLKHYGVSL